MTHFSVFTKTAVILSSLALATGFLLYRTGTINPNITLSAILPTEGSITGFFPDSLKIEEPARTPLLDSAQIAFLRRLMNRYTVPDLEVYTEDHLLKLLDKAEEAEEMMIYSSKSGIVMPHTEKALAQIREIRLTLLADTSEFSLPIREHNEKLDSAQIAFLHRLQTRYPISDVEVYNKEQLLSLLDKAESREERVMYSSKSGMIIPYAQTALKRIKEIRLLLLADSSEFLLPIHDSLGEVTADESLYLLKNGVVDSSFQPHNLSSPTIQPKKVPRPKTTDSVERHDKQREKSE